MSITQGKTLHDIVVTRYRKGELVIGVNKSSMLNNYAQLSENPLVKLFHCIVCLYTFPGTIIGVIVLLACHGKFLSIGFYLGGLVALMALEQHISHKITINRALKNQDVFSDLVKRGIIRVTDMLDPDRPV